MATGVNARARPLILVGAAGALLLVASLSIGVGTRFIPFGQVWSLLLHPDGSDAAAVVHDLRLPRTLLGILAGAALGTAGALMQALTRNPLADPGLLGVNAGAALAMVVAFLTLGVDTAGGQLWFAFAGAALASVAVYAIGATTRGGPTPIRMVLAGAAVSAALLALVQGAILLDPITLDRFRFWAVGALAGRESGVVSAVAWPILAGLALAFPLGRALNVIALGEGTGAALGVNLARARLATVVAVTVLCGAATAAAGPIAFLGLAVPHLARALFGPDQRWVLPASALLAPTLLLAADIVGRLVDRPAEIQVAVVCAFLGAPVLIAVARRPRVVVT
ncbi:iron chelate uptake ABC transporter family permease subunit [Streptosporangium sp. NPDC051022]|uniref:iron chelate uptake ABC transporter family permease subunit n=1 Tax=Streptosporangium sp. NPDC051022 TaxID=3155752 RepID=UPI0034218C4E